MERVILEETVLGTLQLCSGLLLEIKNSMFENSLIVSYLKKI